MLFLFLCLTSVEQFLTDLENKLGGGGEEIGGRNR